jgi:uncharacterized membrane protein YeiB
VTGVDVARGVALLGMMAAHVFDRLSDDGTPTTATVLAAGRSAATFALLAGLSVAFLSGGRAGVHSRGRATVSAGLAVRALLIGAIGLLLGFLDTDVDVILPYYAVLFLLAIPLLTLPPKALAALSFALIVLGPILLVTTARMGLEFGTGGDPTPVTLVTDPVGVLVQLFVTGEYPVVLYLAYLCVGLAIGRLDLSAPRVAGWLLGGGVALAVAAQMASRVLLYPLGGLASLMAEGGSSGDPAQSETELLWNAEQGTSWWYLALTSPHSNTQLDMAHTLGSAMAVLGAALLLARVPVLRRLLMPLAPAGAMTLTLYSSHIVVLESGVLDIGVLEDDLRAQYLVQVFAVLVFAVLWRRWHRQGPLETLVGKSVTRAHRAVFHGAPATDH